jgi:tetratricopeptide (TPR) repeat protein
VIALIPCAPNDRVEASEETEKLEAKARALYDEGVEAYQKDDYEHALRVFEQAYKLIALPRLLYNIAQVHHLKGDCDKARDFYQTYLHEERDPAVRAKTEARLAAMNACVSARQTTAAPVSATIAPPPPVEHTSHAPELILGGAGVALGAAGAVAFALSKSAFSDLRAQCVQGCAPQIWQTWRDGQDVSVVLMSAGGAALVTALLLYVLDPGKEGSP